MTDEAKRAVDWLNGLASGKGFASYLIGAPEEAAAAAAVIMELAEELEEKSKCLAGLEIMYGKAEATNTTLYRRCDAAEDKLSELLSHVTGGRFSKPTYSIAEMKIFIEDYQQSECDVCDDVAQLVRERDAAVRDLRRKHYGCDACKHFSGIRCALPVELRKHSFTCWEWRGLCAGNGGANNGKEADEPL